MPTGTWIHERPCQRCGLPFISLHHEEKWCGLKCKLTDKAVFSAKTGCWLYPGAPSPDGYIRIQIGSRQNKTRRKVLVHRLCYQLFVGKIGRGLVVCHHCDTPACIRPDHLFVGTDQDNATDAQWKGRKRKRLTDDEVRAMRRLRERGDLLSTLAHHFGVTESMVSRIVRGLAWKHIH